MDCVTNKANEVTNEPAKRHKPATKDQTRSMSVELAACLQAKKHCLRLAEIAIPDGHNENGEGCMCTRLWDALRLHVPSRRLNISRRSGLVVWIINNYYVFKRASELWEETSSRNDLEQSSEDKKNCIQCTARLGQLGSVTAIKCRNIQRNMLLSKAWTSARLGQSAEKVKGGCLWRLPHDFQKPRHSPSPTATNGSGLDLHWTNSSSATRGLSEMKIPPW